MEMLPHRHLTTLALDVDFAGVTPIGQTRAGFRGIAPVTGGRFTGERLSGTVGPGQDWFVTRPDGSIAIDVRLTLTTGDGVTVYLNYQGAMNGRGDAMSRFRKGEQLAADDYALTVTARLECGDARYAWLNDATVVGVGEQTPGGPVYHLFDIGR
ncbi:DUF3237 domain-containing protein [Sphingomonas sp.]|uniref:DUF3237 domain-containing protein n=1 Tax=Sphingomonas sp. TaxID=28214 RepID=UPI003CC510E6